MSIERRLKDLEIKFGYEDGRVPGTSIVRTLTKDGMKWTLSLGLMQSPKNFFLGDTIEECLQLAEKSPA